MRVICPLVACASLEKWDKFLGLLGEIAKVTLASEPKTLAYGWFPSAGDNDGIPTYWVRGFEVYQDEDAHLQVHRASAPYKRMREAIESEDILSQPLDLRILQPWPQLIVVVEYSPRREKKAELLQALQGVAHHAASNEHSTLSFWGLEDAVGDENDDVLVFARFASHAAYQAHRSSAAVRDLESIERSMPASPRVTRWVEGGIGHINRGIV